MPEATPAAARSSPGAGTRGMALVTGASGFLGSHLVDALVQESWRVRCLVRPTSNLRWLPAARPELAYAALEDGSGQSDALAAALEGVTVVFHLAGLTSAQSTSAYEHVNVQGTRRLLAAVRERAAPALVVYCSSLAAAGPARAGRPLVESDPPLPIGPYGASKLAAEHLVAASGLDHVIVRPPAVYGPRDSDVLAVFRLAARGFAVRLAPADQRLSLVHVRDVAHGLMDAAEHGAGEGVFYVSDGRIHAWSDVIAAIGAAVGRAVRALPVPRPAATALAHASRLLARLTGSKPLLTPERVRDLGQRDWTCDDSRARRELGYRSAFELSAGMADTAAWYRANRWL
ncbi:MAG: NAD-dependent epimerase/dehydratase family protein [Gemmatimonadetes bacterium]|nr:NAD-dependent epimerase/dehydratase family protein [Gemmatimonadota bacterium]